MDHNDKPWTERDNVFRYTRKQAMRDGILVDISNSDFGHLCRQIGITVNLAMTDSAWSQTVGRIDDPLPPGQTIEGRVWDVLYAFRYAVAMQGTETDRVHFNVSVKTHDGTRQTVPLWSLIGPGDVGEPVITIMLKGED